MLVSVVIVACLPGVTLHNTVIPSLVEFLISVHSSFSLKKDIVRNSAHLKFGTPFLRFLCFTYILELVKMVENKSYITSCYKNQTQIRLKEKRPFRYPSSCQCVVPQLCHADLPAFDVSKLSSSPSIASSLLFIHKPTNSKL